MERNLILAGVGGQGILSMAYVICNAALEKGLNVKQAEVHGMAQRGGAVHSHLRISDLPIYSDLIPCGKANLIIGVEPLEVLRYVHYMAPEGLIITSTVPFQNIPDYPAPEDVLSRIAGLGSHVLLDSLRLAKHVGNLKCQNTVLLGAAAGPLGFDVAEFGGFVREIFAAKGPRVVETNIRALNLGHRATDFCLCCLSRGMSTSDVANLINAMPPRLLEDEHEHVLPAAVENARGDPDALRRWLEEQSPALQEVE